MLPAFPVLLSSLYSNPMSPEICLHLELCWPFFHAFLCQNVSHFHCLFLDSFQVCHGVETWCFGQDKLLLRIETSVFNTVMNWTRLLGSKEPRKERCQQLQFFLPALITAISFISRWINLPSGPNLFRWKQWSCALDESHASIQTALQLASSVYLPCTLALSLSLKPCSWILLAF